MTSLGDLQARLARIAASMEAADHCPTFTIDPVPVEGDGLDAFLGQLRLGEGANWLVRVEECGFEEVLFALRRWLRDECVSVEQQMTALLGDSPVVVERVLVESPRGEFLRPFYECDWDDFVITAGGSRYVLHLGVSD